MHFSFSTLLGPLSGHQACPPPAVPGPVQADTTEALLLDDEGRVRGIVGADDDPPQERLLGGAVRPEQTNDLFKEGL